MDKLTKIYGFEPYGAVSPKEAMDYIVNQNTDKKLNGGFNNGGTARAFTIFIEGTDWLNVNGFEEWGTVYMHYVREDDSRPELTGETFEDLMKALELTRPTDIGQIERIHKALKNCASKILNPDAHLKDIQENIQQVRRMNDDTEKCLKDVQKEISETEKVIKEARKQSHSAKVFALMALSANIVSLSTLLIRMVILLQAK